MTSAMLCAGLMLCCSGDGEEGFELVSRSPSDAALVPPPGAHAGEVSASVERAFPTALNPGVTFPECTLASPLRFDSPSRGTEVVVTSGATVAALDPATGALRWEVVLSTSDNEVAYAVSTPVFVGSLLVVAYASHPASIGPRSPGTHPRLRHLVAVVDVESGDLHEEFEPVELDGSFLANDGVSTIPFRPSNALNRSALAHAVAAGDTLGRVFVSFGNVRDIQPWHGFLFEVHLDRWQSEGPTGAISGSMITTPETDCGPSGVSGSRDRICGGGLWSPGGHLVVEDKQGAAIIVATGNGQLDIPRGDFANALLRLRPGLDWSSGCDEALCADFSPDEPARACLESCSDAFIHRLPEGEEMPLWDPGCDGMTLYECWGALDYTGGSTPIHVESANGLELVVSTGKDGGLYLIDADHLGTLYDRAQITETCGTLAESCRWDWAGTVVSTPVHAEVLPGEDWIIVPTFVADDVHPAGVVESRITSTTDGSPEVEVRWRAPRFETREATRRFRRHPSRLAVQSFDEAPEVLFGWVVETAPARSKGRLMAVRLWDGSIEVDAPLAGPGYRFVQPLIVDDTIYVNSCDSEEGPSYIEAYTLRAMLAD